MDTTQQRSTDKRNKQALESMARFFRRRIRLFTFRKESQGAGICGRGSFFRGARTNWGDKDESPEQRANRYAAELLMPDTMFQPRSTGLPLNFHAVRTLCAVFNTSLTATAIRLVDLSSYNGMIVCYEYRRRRWFHRGPDVPEALWPYEQLSKFTKAAELPNTTGAQAWGSGSADSWVSHPDSWQYNVHEDSIVVAPNMTLSLVWWQNEKQILDLNKEQDG